MNKLSINIIILGAGQGTRMKSKKPKVLHEIANFSMLEIVNKVSEELTSKKNIVNLISKEVEQYSEFKINNPVIQEDRLGTGHAVKIAVENFDLIQEKTVILYADTPLVKIKTIESMLKQNYDLILCGFEVSDISKKYGRIITNHSNKDFSEIYKLVEYKDATHEEKEETLCNAGIMVIKTSLLKELIFKIDNNNEAKEFYLTDLVKLTQQKNQQAFVYHASELEFQGANSRKELAELDATLQDNLKSEHMDNGVTFMLPNTTYISYDTEIENDCIVEPNVFIGKGVKIHSGVRIKSFSRLEDCEIKS